jgi:hypothetical protein
MLGKEEAKKKEESGGISRREFLKDAGICAGCAAIGGATILSSCAGKTTTQTVTSTVTTPVTKSVTVTTTQAAAVSYSMTVIDPTSDYEVTSAFAPRLDTLNNKTIAFHACAPTKWQPHRIFPYIQDKLSQKFTGMKFIPLTEFPQSQAGIDSADTAKSAKDKGANAVINGFAA